MFGKDKGEKAEAKAEEAVAGDAVDTGRRGTDLFELTPEVLAPSEVLTVDATVPAAELSDAEIITPDAPLAVAELSEVITEDDVRALAERECMFYNVIDPKTEPGDGFDPEELQKDLREEEMRRARAEMVLELDGEAGEEWDEAEAGYATGEGPSEGAAAAGALAGAAAEEAGERKTWTEGEHRFIVLEGTEFNTVVPPEMHAPLVSIPGTGMDGRIGSLDLDRTMISGNTMIVGGSSENRTLMFRHIISQIRSRMSMGDVALVFDGNGTLYRELAKDGDVVIGRDLSISGPFGTEFWNLFMEVDPDDVDSSIWSLSRSLFGSRSGSVPAEAAADVLYALMHIFYDSWEQQNGTKPTNRAIAEFLRRADREYILKVLNSDNRYASVANHLSDPDSETVQAVISEINAAVNRMFIGNLSKDGEASVTELVRSRGARCIFIEYDAGSADSLVPIYRTMVDTALRQAISDSSGNLYLFADDMRHLSGLSHLNDAVNMGSGSGVNAFIAVQSIGEIRGSLNGTESDVLLSRMDNCMFFSTNDAETREYIRGRFGRCLMKVIDGAGNSNVYSDDVVSDSDMSALGPGEAIVGLGSCPPFVFRPEYQNR